MDWKNDPEMKAIRDEYIEGLKKQLSTLQAWNQSWLPKGELSDSQMAELQRFAHSLSGSSGSFGLPILSMICGHVDDLIDLRHSQAAAIPVASFSEFKMNLRRVMLFIERSLNQIVERGEEAADLKREPEAVFFTSYAESLLAGASF